DPQSRFLGQLLQARYDLLRAAEFAEVVVDQKIGAHSRLGRIDGARVKVFGGARPGRHPGEVLDEFGVVARIVLTVQMTELNRQMGQWNRLHLAVRGFLMKFGSRDHSGVHACSSTILPAISSKARTVAVLE